MSGPKIHPLFAGLMGYVMATDAIVSPTSRRMYQEWVDAGYPLVDEPHQTSYVLVRRDETNEQALFRRIAGLETELAEANKRAAAANDEATWAKGALLGLREDIEEILNERKGAP